MARLYFMTLLVKLLIHVQYTSEAKRAVLSRKYQCFIEAALSDLLDGVGFAPTAHQRIGLTGSRCSSPCSNGGPGRTANVSCA
jgi:hypothetical protein